MGVMPSEASSWQVSSLSSTKNLVPEDLRTWSLAVLTLVALTLMEPGLICGMFFSNHH
jgi:hypothetical protein